MIWNTEWSETNWNDLERASNELKRPETTYNKQKMTWNELQIVRNYLKQPQTS